MCCLVVHGDSRGRVMRQNYSKGSESNNEHNSFTRQSSSQKYNNLISRYRVSSKEADLTFVPHISANWTTEAEFPGVVPESGWSEPADQLQRDAALWHQGSEGQVRIVIQVKFIQRSENQIGARLWISRANPQGGATQILPAVNDHDGSSTIAFPELFARDCPLGIDPVGSIVLDLATLWVLAIDEILALDRLHDDDIIHLQEDWVQAMSGAH
ncbi:hypothetical protein HOY80DRAFT_1021045 [Tuber brumale]|nr:hypothetical protein HOY80DRAFT_1021045 [Tuber brumale]